MKKIIVDGKARKELDSIAYDINGTKEALDYLTSRLGKKRAEFWETARRFFPETSDNACSYSVDDGVAVIIVKDED